MACRPASAESLDGLRQLQRTAADRGDLCLSLLLAGVELYVRAGRELELLEAMRHGADELCDAIENTPTAEQLKQLFERDC